jgi:hypothetical protein
MEPLNKKDRCDADRDQLQVRVTGLEADRIQMQADRDQLHMRVTGLEADRDRVQGDRDRLRVHVSDRDEIIADLRAALDDMAYEGERNASDGDESAETQGEEINDDEFSIQSDSTSDFVIARGGFDRIVEMLQPNGWPEGKDLEISWGVMAGVVVNIDLFCGLLRGNTVIRRARVELCAGAFNSFGPSFYHECMTKLGEALGSLKALEDLQLEGFGDLLAQQGSSSKRSRFGSYRCVQHRKLTVTIHEILPKYWPMQFVIFRCLRMSTWRM